MTLPTWKITQRRSEKGLRQWCALVLEGESPLIPANRLLPVLRNWDGEELDLGNRRFEARPDRNSGGQPDWWMKPGAHVWRSLLSDCAPVWIRIASDDGSPTRTVAGDLGVWTIDEVEICNEGFSLSLIEQIAKAK